jgi:hypothetical protein
MNSGRKKFQRLSAWWNDPKTENKIQSFLVIINILMLIAFIVFSQKQSDYTAESLKETRRSIDIAKESAKLELRAYIQVAEVNITEIKINRPLGVSVTYKNTGITPALTFR